MQKILFTLLVFLASTSVVAGGDYMAGKIKAYTCSGCHGIVNYNNAYPTYRVPRVGGQNKEYMVSALQAFKSGERTHKNMNLQAEALSDQDIEDISVYLAAQTNTAGAESVFSADGVAAGQSKTASCQACHGVTGISSQPIYPHLAGQHQNYLSKALHDFRDGNRPSAIMSGFAAGLSDADIEDIAAWYADQEGLTEIQDK